MRPCEQSPVVSRAEALDAAEGREEKGISEAKAEEFNGALANVQRLLRAAGIRSYSVRSIGLKLLGSGEPYPKGQIQWHVPELFVRSDAGWLTATVTMGTRSGCYLVSVRGGTGLQTAREPEQVAHLILATPPGGTT
ncbi:hypothetical protein AB0M44_37250 [Streptosporangium subroseum]|uniref:hypothetical protein n=1 Tax=Streptosporangium subroseum TaxID=106412 RepID=UPI0034327B52